MYNDCIYKIKKSYHIYNRNIYLQKSCVGERVSLQVTWMRKSLVTLRTGKLFLSCFTVSLGKGFGSKGKQHHKHTTSETQSHMQ